MNVFDRFRLAWTKRRQARDIGRRGWSGVYVGDYSSAPTWAYTIGFDETLGHPEMIAFDLPRASASGLFWRSFQAVQAGELVIEDGRQAPFTDTRCVWRKVHHAHLDEWLTLACMRRFECTGKRSGLQAWQLVLSDGEGILPWESGYDERLRHLQRPLWDPPSPWAQD